jgi:hypothetical protein
MDFKLSINLDNEAFQDGQREAELARIIASVALMVAHDARPIKGVKVLDSNGNSVGEWSIVGKEV